MSKCWIIGPIAWDRPYQVPSVPSSGQFVQAVRMSGRLGGTGANVARSLASRYSPVGMIGYVGRDDFGKRSVRDLEARGIDVRQVQALPVETSQVLLFIEPSGERTIVGAAEDNLHRITIPVGEIGTGDLVYVAAWRQEFESALTAIDAVGAVVASVPFGRPHGTLPVRYVIGSMSEIPVQAADIWATYSSWTGGALSCVTLTRGAQGAQVLDADGCADRPAVVVQAVDATGAGDAFAAAVLASILEGRPIMSGVQEGLAWGAAAARCEGSIPPPWPDVVGPSQSA